MFNAARYAIYVEYESVLAGESLWSHIRMHTFYTRVLVLATPCVYVQVQQNLKAVFLAYPATSVPDSGDNSSTSEQSTSRYVHMYMQ